MPHYDFCPVVAAAAAADSFGVALHDSLPRYVLYPDARPLRFCGEQLHVNRHLQVVSDTSTALCEGFYLIDSCAEPPIACFPD